MSERDQHKTDRKQVEDELRRIQHDLNRVQALAKTGSWRLDIHKNELLWSDETHRIFGIPKVTPLTYETFIASIHPDDRKYVARKWAAALRGKPYDIEHRIVVGDTVKWVRETAELEFDQTGQLVGGFGTVQDITDRKRVEQALARALDEARRDRSRLEAMESIAEAGISTTELGGVLDMVAERIAHGLGTHSCTIFLLADEQGDLVARAAHGIPEECGFHIKADEGFAGKILATRGTVYIRDAEHDPLITDPHVRRAKTKSLLGTPMIARGHVVGILYVDMLQEREFSRDERRLLEAMASRTALIVENAKLYEQLAKSRDEVQQDFSLLQRSLLPPEGLQMGPCYRVAVAYLSPFGLEIGGDFYDMFDTEAGKHAILIGDVAGKGIPAVSLGASTRSTIRALVYDIPSVSAALTHANSVLCPQVFTDSDSAFVTVFAAVIDPATGGLCYTNAGHPPPAVYRIADGTVDFLEVAGPPLRILPAYEFPEASSCLLPGDKIVLYTDGLSEARRDSELFGEEGVQRILQEYGMLPPEELVAQLLEAASTWAGGNLTDDTAIVVVERENRSSI